MGNPWATHDIPTGDHLHVRGLQTELLTGNPQETLGHPRVTRGLHTGNIAS